MNADLSRSQEVLAEMVHTKDGSRVVREFIVQGSAKVRSQLAASYRSAYNRFLGSETNCESLEAPCSAYLYR